MFISKHKKLIFIFSPLLIFAFASGYLFSQTTIVESTPQSTADMKEIQKVEEKGEIPECFMFKCPQYLETEWAIFGPDIGASVIINPTAMTKGAGQVLIVHLGKIIYRSPELAGIRAHIDTKDSSRLYVSYISDWKNDGMRPKTEKTDELIYQAGEFVFKTMSVREL